MHNKKISIVIPCYYAEQSIAEVVESTISYMDQIEGFEYEFILVNDGSEDNTFWEINKLSLQYNFVLGVDLAKNCGQHNAILAGMKYAMGDYILGMDDDFQTHPSQIYKLIEKLEEGYDIVYGRFPQRHHSIFRNIGSVVNNMTIKWLIGKPKDLKACPMYIIRRFVRDEIIKSNSSYTNLQGLFLRTSSKIANADIEHFDRKFGHSGYNMKKLLRLWSSFMNYSAKPVSIIRNSGIIAFLAGMIYLAAALLVLKNLHIVLSVIVLVSGLLLFALGLEGEYVVRLFMAVTHEPQYIIRQTTESEIYGVKHDEKENTYTWSGQCTDRPDKVLQKN